MKTLSGISLAGGNGGKRKRIENNFYATPKESTLNLCEHEKIKGDILEPCVGQGHILEVLKEKCNYSTLTAVDLIDRGYQNTIIQDFLEWDTTKKFDWIVTNPPYKLAKEFVEKSLTLLKDNGHIAMFLKIQFLEGVARKKFFENYPPKTIYVFSKRQAPLRDGEEFDENGKKWSSTICFAWFIWQKDYKGDTVVKWI